MKNAAGICQIMYRCKRWDEESVLCSFCVKKKLTNCVVSTVNKQIDY